jgi:hypothetical protein
MAQLLPHNIALEGLAAVQYGEQFEAHNCRYLERVPATKRNASTMLDSVQSQLKKSRKENEEIARENESLKALLIKKIKDELNLQKLYKESQKCNAALLRATQQRENQDKQQNQTGTLEEQQMSPSITSRVSSANALSPSDPLLLTPLAATSVVPSVASSSQICTPEPTAPTASLTKQNNGNLNDNNDGTEFFFNVNRNPLGGLLVADKSELINCSVRVKMNNISLYKAKITDFDDDSKRFCCHCDDGSMKWYNIYKLEASRVKYYAYHCGNVYDVHWIEISRTFSWSDGKGNILGGSSTASSYVGNSGDSNSARRAAAATAAERRLKKNEGKKAAAERNRRSRLAGKIEAKYHAKKIDPPFGLRAASLQSLKKLWEEAKKL